MKLIKCYLFPNDNVPGLLVSLSVLRQIGPGPWRCVMGTRPAPPRGSHTAAAHPRCLCAAHGAALWACLGKAALEWTKCIFWQLIPPSFVTLLAFQVFRKYDNRLFSVYLY